MINNRKSGFTLIELITVIVLLGIIGGFGGLFLVKMIQSYQWAEDNAHIAQKAQVALTRIAVEMVYADKNSIAISGNTIEYNATYPDGTAETENKFEQNGSLLIFEKNGSPHTLTDHLISEEPGFEVSEEPGFEVDEENGYITVTLTMRGANNAPQTFTQTMATP